MKRSTFIKLALALAASTLPRAVASSAKAENSPRKLILIAGKPPMMHEFRTRTTLLEKRLKKCLG